MAGDAVSNQDSDIFEISELEGILRGFDDNLFDLNFDFDFFPEPWAPESGALPLVSQAPDWASQEHPDPPEVEGGSRTNLPCFDSSGERFEEVGVDHDGGASDFFSKALVDGSDRDKIDWESPKAYDGQVKDEKEVPISVTAGVEDDDPINKNIRRKIRNRESAMKSRERKKVYTKDLEMKCKSMESECRRLDYQLRCCIIENTVLRQSLQFQKERLCGASMAKQESAVLFVESLLLVSLFWLMSIQCLCLVPGPQCPNLKISSRRGRSGLAPAIAEGRSPPKIAEVKSLVSERLRRRYRGRRRWKMKQLSLFPLATFRCVTC